MQLKENNIVIYEFPVEEGKTEESWMRNLVPFALVGSNSIIQVAHIGLSLLEKYSGW